MCPYENCGKFFGSEGSQNLHIKIKHNGGSKTDREKLAKRLVTAYVSKSLTDDVIDAVDINLPPGATIAALVREGDVIMAHHDEEIQPEDHVIVFLTETDEKYIRAVEKLFQPSPTLL